MPDGARFIFVGGLHRSGTTPLARILGAHPQVSGLEGTGVSEDEGLHLQDVYPRIRAFGGMGRFARAGDAHVTEDSSLVSELNAERLVASWSPFWDLERQFLLEKSPSNLIMGRFLQALFPGSALVVVIRHPIAVALAMQKWNPSIIARNGRRHTTLSGLVGHWLRAHELLRADAPHLARLHVVRYEDLVAAPAERLEEIRLFLGLDAPIDVSAMRNGMSATYRKRWDAMAHGLFKHRVRAAIERKYADAVAAYGYDIADVGEITGPLDIDCLFT
jgi:hypothetical protein